MNEYEYFANVYTIIQKISKQASFPKKNYLIVITFITKTRGLFNICFVSNDTYLLLKFLILDISGKNAALF